MDAIDPRETRLTPAGRPPPATLRLIYDEIAKELDAQFDQIAALNARAQQLLGFAAITIGLVVGLRPPTDDVFVSFLFGLALVCFALLAGFGVRAWAIQGWRHDPKPRPLWERHRMKSEEWVRHQIIQNRLQAAEENAATVDEKLFWVRWTQRLLAVEVLYLVSLVIVTPHIS